MEKKTFKNEILTFINDNNLSDVFITYNDFREKYDCSLYVYFRVSTEKQDFGRQILQAYKWAKDKNIKIFIDNIYCDKYTGKTLKRKAYEELRTQTQKNDFILVTEVSRLGRNWDDVKKEWYKLKAEEINLLIMDYDLLSDELPNEEKQKMTVDRKFMQESIFNGILYAACKKIEEVSRATKGGLNKAKLNGVKLGKPRGSNSSKENLIKTIEYMINNNVGQKKAAIMCKYPDTTLKKDLKKLYTEYNTKDYNEILQKLKEN